MRFLLPAAVALTVAGCASQQLTQAAKKEGDALGLAIKHCQAFGPLATSQADVNKGEKPKIRFGTAIVCYQ